MNFLRSIIQISFILTSTLVQLPILVNCASGTVELQYAEFEQDLDALCGPSHPLRSQVDKMMQDDTGFAKMLKSELHFRRIGAKTIGASCTTVLQPPAVPSTTSYPFGYDLTDYNLWLSDILQDAATSCVISNYLECVNRTCQCAVPVQSDLRPDGGKCVIREGFTCATPDFLASLEPKMHYWFSNPIYTVAPWKEVFGANKVDCATTSPCSDGGTWYSVKSEARACIDTTGRIPNYNTKDMKKKNEDILDLFTLGQSATCSMTWEDKMFNPTNDREFRSRYDDLDALVTTQMNLCDIKKQFVCDRAGQCLCFSRIVNPQGNCAFKLASSCHPYYTHPKLGDKNPKINLPTEDMLLPPGTPVPACEYGICHQYGNERDCACEPKKHGPKCTEDDHPMTQGRLGPQSWAVINTTLRHSLITSFSSTVKSFFGKMTLGRGIPCTQKDEELLDDLLQWIEDGANDTRKVGELYEKISLANPSVQFCDRQLLLSCSTSDKCECMKNSAWNTTTSKCQVNQQPPSPPAPPQQPQPPPQPPSPHPPGPGSGEEDQDQGGGQPCSANAKCIDTSTTNPCGPRMICTDLLTSNNDVPGPSCQPMRRVAKKLYAPREEKLQQVEIRPFQTVNQRRKCNITTNEQMFNTFDLYEKTISNASCLIDLEKAVNELERTVREEFPPKNNNNTGRRYCSVANQDPKETHYCAPTRIGGRCRCRDQNNERCKMKSGDAKRLLIMISLALVFSLIVLVVEWYIDI